LNKYNRLVKSSEFANVRNTGHSCSDRNLVLVVATRDFLEGGDSRYGLIVSNRIGNAVYRNKCKRRLREAIGTFTIQKGFDLVFIARNPLPDCTYVEICESMCKLLTRASLIQVSNVI